MSESIKRRIKKLLNLAADDNAFEGEISNAMALAQKLMDEHHVTEADLTDDERTEQMARKESWTGGANLSVWESSLCDVVSSVIGTVDCYIAGRFETRGASPVGRPSTKTQVMWYGPTEDVEIAVQMYHDMVALIISMANLRWGGCYKGDGRAYSYGFVKGLQDQVAKSRVQKEIDDRAAGGGQLEATSCTAIVLKSKELARTWLEKDQGIKLRSRSGGYSDPRSNSSNGAFSEGRTDGRNADISFGRRPKLTGSKGALPK